MIIFTNRLFQKNKKIIKKERKKHYFEKRFYSPTTRKYLFLVSTILCILTIFFSFSLTNIDFEYDSKKLEVKGQESIRTTELIQNKFNISTDPAIFYTYDRNEGLEDQQDVP